MTRALIGLLVALPLADAPAAAQDAARADDPRLASMSPEIRKMVLEETDSARANCETDGAMMIAYECDCYAREVFERRLRAGTETGPASARDTTGKGPSVFSKNVRMEMQTMAACVSTSKLEDYGRRMAAAVGASSAVGDCVGRELAVHFIRQPNANAAYITGLLNEVIGTCGGVSGGAAPPPSMPAAVPPAGSAQPTPTPAPSSSGESTGTARAVSSPRSASGERLTLSLAALHTVRHHPNLIDGFLENYTRMLIRGEQDIWRQLGPQVGQYAKQQGLNPQRPLFAFEWQRVNAQRPELARGALMDAFLYPGADWNFVEQERGWDRRLKAYVAGFVFAREKVEGRAPEFAAHELAPVAKQHLQAAAAAVTSSFWLLIDLPPGQYDFERKGLRFQVPNVAPADGFELGEGPRDVGASRMVYPPATKSTANYATGAVRVLDREEPQRPGLPMRSGTQAWRESFGGLSTSFGSGLPNFWMLALDRALRISFIPVDAKLAERVALEQKKLRAKVNLEATRVELGDFVVEGTPGKFAVMFATLRNVEIYTPDDELVTTLQPETFPVPPGESLDTDSRPATPAGPAPGPAAASASTAGQAAPVPGPAETPEQIRERLRRESEVQLARARRASECTVLAIKMNPDERSSEYQSVFATCMASAPGDPARDPAPIQATQAASQSPSPAGSPAECSKPLKSVAGGAQLNVEFVNASGAQRKVFWIDFAGNRQPYGVMEPGQRGYLQTYVGHPWLFTNASGACTGTFTIAEGAHRVEIR